MEGSFLEEFAANVQLSFEKQIDLRWLFFCPGGCSAGNRSTEPHGAGAVTWNASQERQIVSNGGRAQFVACDVTNSDAQRAAFAKCVISTCLRTCLAYCPLRAVDIFDGLWILCFLCLCRL